MNWEMIAAIGQVLGSIAVLVTLIYLAGQLRESRRETRRLINKSRTESLRELYSVDATDESLAELVEKARVGLGAPAASTFRITVMERTGLSQQDVSRLISREAAWWNYRAQIIRDVGELTPGQRTEFDSGIRSYYGANTFGGLFYQAGRTSLDPEAIRYIDSVLAQSE